jgi:hypothetical protein
MEHPDQYGPINTPIKDTKLGLGVSIINDRIGPSDENNLAVDFLLYQYIRGFQLSFGLKASANL